MALSRNLSALFVEMRARIARLDWDLQAAERSFRKLTDFVLKRAA